MHYLSFDICRAPRDTFLKRCRSLNGLSFLTLAMVFMLCGAVRIAQAADSDESGATSADGASSGQKETAAEKSEDDIMDTAPAGLVYFIGSVERVINGFAIIDLGEVHLMRSQLKLAAFRPRDDHFTPLGTLTVLNTHPSWSQMDHAAGFVPAVGDLIVSIETVGNIGTTDRLRDRFLARRQIIDSGRNSYNTVRDQEIADSLQAYAGQQPRWVSERMGVVGTVFGDSYAAGKNSRLENILNQINQFRRLQAQQIPVSTAAGQEWSTVMEPLQGPIEASIRPTMVRLGRRSVMPQQVAEPVGPMPIHDIRRLVETKMFERNHEEQAIAAAMCLFLLKSSIRDEATWLRMELARSQFPKLAKDQQYQLDIAGVLRILREEPS